MYNPRKLVIGDGELTCFEDKIAELQEEAKHSKNPKSEYKIMIQFAEIEPVIFDDKKTHEEISYTSCPLGLWVTISREDLLKYQNSGVDLLPIVIKRKDIETYLVGQSHKFGISAQNGEYSKDIETELNPFHMENLYTDLTKVNTPPKKKFSKVSIYRYGKLYGPVLLWKFIQNMPEEVKELAYAIFAQLFGESLLDKFFENENKNRYHNHNHNHKNHDDEMELG